MIIAHYMLSVNKILIRNIRMNNIQHILFSLLLYIVFWHVKIKIMIILHVYFDDVQVRTNHKGMWCSDDVQNIFNINVYKCFSTSELVFYYWSKITVMKR